MKKRIFLKDLKAYDLANHTSLVRLLEMTVDHIDTIGYSMQFWKDMNLYGIDEASAYIKSQLPKANYIEFDRVVEEIKATLTKETVA